MPGPLKQWAAALLSAAARYGIYWLLLALVIAAAADLADFRTAGNLANVAQQSAALAILAVGQTFVIAAGLIDLSVGQLLGLIAVLACDLLDGRPELTLPAVLLALAVGAGVGGLNGWLHNRLRIHPLILTFGMLSVLQGAIFVYTDRSVGAASPALLWIANGTLAGVPASALLVAVIAVGATLLLQRTRFGVHVRAVGASEENARRAGLDSQRIELVVYLMSGLGAAVAGLVLAGRLGTGYPNAGAGFELDAIVAVVLGGTPLAGGRGTIAGTLAAVVVLAVVSNILNLLGMSAFIQMAVKGVIVVLAVLVNQPRRTVPA